MRQRWTWQDDDIAVAHTAVTFSPNQRFAVIGDTALLAGDWYPMADLRSHPMTDPAAAQAAERLFIAQQWEEQGTGCLNRLQGMFAFAVWDRERRELWLVRDPVGAYPLYYTTTGATRWVAPRLATLNPFRTSELDEVALRDYLCCAFVPGERTLWKQVRKVRPGTYRQLRAETGGTYWPLREAIHGADRSLEWHGQRLRAQLEQGVRDHLPQAEPVGIYLSGGLDSSYVTALAARLHDQTVHTYSIHFGRDFPNELAFSSLVAEQYQTQHHVIEISPQRLWQRLPETLALLDEPIGDPLTVPNRIMAETASQAVRVVLNGEGGDPCFGGPKNQPMLLNQLYAAYRTGDIPDENPGQIGVTAYLRSFQKCATDLPRLMRPQVWQTAQSAPSVFAADLQDSSMEFLNRLMALNIKFKGTDHILTKVNNLTRAANLIGRSPLFDPRMVALSMTIPPTFKLSGAEEKAVLKAAAADLLPEAILHRPKSGMLVPVQYGFRQVWQADARRLLLHRRAKIAPYLNQALIRQWLAYEGDVWGRYGVKLWLLVSLEFWLQANQW